MEFRGRSGEIHDIRNLFRNYGNDQRSWFLNIHARSGMGKTALVKQVCKEAEEEDLENNYDIKYIDVSYRDSFESILLEIRLSYKDQGEIFKEFDALYTLFFDTQRYKEILSEQKMSEEFNLGTDDRKNLLRKLKNEIKNSEQKIFSDIIVAALRIAMEAAAEVSGQSVVGALFGPVLSNINWINLAHILAECLNKEEAKMFNDIYKRGKNLNKYERCGVLVEYFSEAMNRLRYIRKKIIVVDNYENGYNVNNEGFFFGQNGVVAETHAFWLFCSHNPIANDFNGKVNVCDPLALQGLDISAVQELIDDCNLSDKLSQDNRKELIELFREKSQGRPLMLVILLRILEERLKEEESKAPGRDSYYINQEVFKGNFNEEDQLRYYFEMGKSDTERDCFRVLSCKEIWDDYFYDVVCRNIPLYLLKTRNVLENDCLIEEITEGKIKLHEDVKRSLYRNVYNRIKYDVMEIMYRNFIWQQEREPITDINILKDYYHFICEMCENMRNRRFRHLHTTPVQVYENFHHAFYRSVSYMEKYYDLTVNDAMFQALYGEVMNSYEAILQSDESEENLFREEYLNALYKYGLHLYNTGRITEASEIDRKYMDLTEKKYEAEKAQEFTLKKGIDLSKSYNAYGYDLSALQRYAEANKYGTKAIEIVCDAMQRATDEKIPEKLLSYIKELDETENKDRKSEIFASLERSIGEIQKDSRTWEALSQLLVNRGNMPWYWINIPEEAPAKWDYAIQYGYNTWKLREIFWGKEYGRTLTSMHNYGVYKIKVGELGIKGIIPMTNSTIKSLLTEGQGQLYDLMKIFYNKTDFNPDVCDYIIKGGPDILKSSQIKAFPERYLTKDKDFRSRKDITGYALLYGDKACLETGQYLGFAYYCLSLLQRRNNNGRVSHGNIDNAIRLGDQVLVSRTRILGENHKKTIETLYYTALYYKKAAECHPEEAADYLKEARRRAELAVERLGKIKPSRDLEKEYEALWNELNGGDTPG